MEVMPGRPRHIQPKDGLSYTPCWGRFFVLASSKG
jgi:hypothetical protein